MDCHSTVAYHTMKEKIRSLYLQYLFVWLRSKEKSMAESKDAFKGEEVVSPGWNGDLVSPPLDKDLEPSEMQ